MTVSSSDLARLLVGDERAVREVMSRCADSRAVLSLARAHGVGGLVLGRLANAGVALPPEVAERERVRDVEARLWFDRASLALAQVTSAMEEAGVRAVTLKGPSLAERLYPEAPHHRLSVDLDLLVVPDDLDRATQALAPLGYVRGDGPWDRYLRRHHHAVHLAHGALPTVDLHFSASEGTGVSLPAAPIVVRAVSTRTSLGATALVPSPADELVYLAVHAVSHRLARLSWLCDVARLLERGVDVEAARTRAREAGVLGSLLVVARALEERLGISTPALVADDAPTRARVAAAAALAGVDVRERGPGESALTFAVVALTCDRPRDLASFSARKVVRFVDRVARYRALRGAPPP